MGSRNGAAKEWAAGVEMDGPATRRLVRALEAGVSLRDCEARFGHSAGTLRRAALDAGWDGSSRGAAARSPPPSGAARVAAPEWWRG